MNKPWFVPLGDIADFINGCAFKPEDWHETGLPIIRIQNLTSPDAPFNRTERIVPEKYRVVAGDLLVSWSATLGVFSWDGLDALVNQHIFKVVADRRQVNLDYLRHALDASIHEMEKFTHGSTMKHINRAEFLGHRIPLPDLDEQRRIAAILDKADALRQKRKRAIALLESLTQSIFLKMFGVPGEITNSATPQRPLGELAQLINGDRSRNYPSGDDIVSSGILFLNTTNITPEGLDLKSANYITEQKFASLTRGKLAPGDIVITLRGSLGQTAIFEDVGETGFINAQMMIIRPGDKIDRRYLLQALQLDSTVAHFKKIGSGSAVPQLTGKQMSEFLIPLPELNQQRIFAERKSSLLRTRQVALQNMNNSEQLFASLQHRAFAGEL